MARPVSRMVSRRAYLFQFKCRRVLPIDTMMSEAHCKVPTARARFEKRGVLFHFRLI